MRTVYKYPVQVTDAPTVRLPKGAQVLTVQEQCGDVFMWALVDPSAEKEARTFRIAGTGHPVDDGLELKFVSTFQMRGGALVFHVFEVVERPEVV
jgi:hypothetical protein